jgi:hypothetical protein
MPTLSVFFGITVMMYWVDIGQHNLPHIHAEYAEHEVVINIETNQVIVGHFPRRKLKLLQAWVDLHQDELMANWEAAADGETIQKIEPLR